MSARKALQSKDRKLNFAAIAAAILMAGLLALLFRQDLSRWVYSHARTETVTFMCYGTGNGIPLRIVDNTVYATADSSIAPYDQWYGMRYSNNADGLFELNKSQYWDSPEAIEENIVANDGFRILEETQAGKSRLVFEGGQTNAVLSVEMRIYPSTCISVERNGTGFGLLISRDTNPEGDWIMAATFAEQETSFSQKIFFYDLEDYAYILPYYFAGYAALFFLFLAAILLFLRLSKALIRWTQKTGVLLGSHPRAMFLAVLFLFTACVWTCYALSPERYQIGEGADAYYYGYPERQAIFLDESGKFSLDLFIQNGWTHRSYFPLALYYILNRLAAFAQFDEKYLHLLLNGVFIAIAVAVAFPELVRALLNRRAKDWEMLAFAAVFFYYWSDYFFYELTDVPGAAMAMLALAEGVILVKEPCWKRACVFGAASALAIAYRASYFIMFELGMAALAVVFVWRLFRGWRAGKIRAALKMVPVLLVTALVFVSIMLPQAYINYRKGHIGLMPYNDAKAYNVAKNDMDKSQWGAMSGYKFISQKYLDRQLNRITESFFPADVNPAMSDIPFLLLANPVEMVIGLLKRLCYALSVYRELIYPTTSYTPGNVQLLEYMFHYFLMGNVLYYGWIQRGRRSFLKINSAIVACFVLQVLSQVALFQIERRFYLLFFLLIYFFNVCCVPACIKEDLLSGGEGVKARQGRYVAFVAAFLVLSFTMLQTIAINF